MARNKKGGGARAAKPARRKEPEVVDLDAVEAVESGGATLEDGIVLTTTLFLGIACWLIYSAYSTYAPAS